MMDFYIAKKIRISNLSTLETLCWVFIVTFPLAIIFHIIELIIAKHIVKKYYMKRVVVVEDDCVKIFYKNYKVKLLYSEIKDVTYSSVAISKYDLSYKFDNVTERKPYGNLTIKTNNKKYVIKYLEYGSTAKNMILQKQYLL